MGLQEGGRARAYPFRTLTENPVVNDVLGDRFIVVTFDAESAAGVVFDRVVEGQRLTFDLVDTQLWESLAMRDRETGTVWRALTGETIDGSLEG